MVTPIAVNARYRGRRLTGVERYADALINQLGLKARLIKSERIASGWRGHLWEQFSLPGRVRPDEILWSPANTGPLRLSRQVVTIHDLSPLDHPEWFKPFYALWYRFLLPRLARRAQTVVTVSEFSRQRLLHRLKLPSSQVSIVSGAVDPTQFRPLSQAEIDAVKSCYQLPPSYVVFLGTLEPRKNLPRLLQAWQRSGLAAKGVVLVIAGIMGQVFRQVRVDLSVDGIHWIGYIPDEHLPGLYAGALFLVYPSLYEGFGLPALEAMACGAPVLVSNAGALPEVVGEAGIPVDPYDVEALSEALQRLADDLELRRHLVRLGFDQSRYFSWEFSAAKLMEVFETCQN